MLIYTHKTSHQYASMTSYKLPNSNTSLDKRNWKERKRRIWRDTISFVWITNLEGKDLEGRDLKGLILLILLMTNSLQK